MNKPIKYYNPVRPDNYKHFRSNDNTKLVENFIKKGILEVSLLESVVEAMLEEDIYAVGYEFDGDFVCNVILYTKESEESAEVRYQENLKKYDVWLSKEEDRLAFDAKKLGYKLVKE